MKDLTRGHEAKTILLFAFPMLLGSVFQQLYNMVDSIVVGTFVGKQALAAVGQSFPVMFVAIALLTGLGMAGNILISQFFGARQTERLQSVVDTTIRAMLVFALVVTVLGLALAPLILRLMRTPDDVMIEAVVYLRIIFAGSLASFGYNAVSAILRGLGDSKTPVYALIVSTLVNAALDLVFVVVFRWGVAGAAVATVIAQTVSLVWVLAYLRKREKTVSVSLWGREYDRDLLRELIRLGLPSGIQQGLVGAGLMALTGVVNRFGTNAAAAYSAVGKLDSFVIMPAMNIGLAMSTFTGQNLGAGRNDRVGRGLRYGLLASLGITAIVSALLFFAGGLLVRLFSDDREVVRIGAEYFRILSFAYVFQAAMFCVSGVIRGAGDTVFTMLMTLLSMWVIRVPLAFVLSAFWGTSGIWFSVDIGYCVGIAGTALYYFFGPWRSRVSASISV